MYPGEPLKEPTIKESFIEVYDDVIHPGMCANFIEFFEDKYWDKYRKIGASGGSSSQDFSKVDDPDKLNKHDRELYDQEQTRLKTVKNTRELTLENMIEVSMLNVFSTGKFPRDIFGRFARKYNNKINQFLTKYINRYKVFGSPEIHNNDGELLEYVSEDYVKSRLAKMFPHQIQQYKKGEGHYSGWHCEYSPSSLEQASRSLIYLFYLNDVEEGGETEFYNQKIKVKPKAGRLVIFPAYFTHIHKGHVPISNDKYIITSMYGEYINPNPRNF
tara:strand:- start:3 stop:821 length:819 start_codon:yes stop_codon:yes gene_type:complete